MARKAAPQRRSWLENVEEDFLAQLRWREDRANAKMARAYATAVDTLVPLWERAYSDLMKARNTPGMTPEYLSGYIQREARLAVLVTRSAEEFDKVARVAAQELTDSQRMSVYLAQNSVTMQLAGELARGPAGVTVPVGVLPQAQLEAIIGRTEAGSPLIELFSPWGQSGQQLVRDTLVAGVVNGESPRVVARRLSRDLGTHYGRMELIARTEMLRTYRATTLRTYQNNARLVKQWRWHAALDDRTCVVCWAMHGQTFPLTERMATHPACRCSMLPVLRPWSEIHPSLAGVKDIPTPKTGKELFAKASPETQRKILGPLAFKAYERKLIKLDDLVEVTDSLKWGQGRRRAALNSKLSYDQIRELRTGKTPAQLAEEARQKLMAQKILGPTTRALGPKGEPVGTHLYWAGPKTLGPSSRELKAKGDAAMALVDRVHGDGGMRPVPFSFDSGDPSFYGVYGSRLGYTKDGRSTLEPKYLKLSSLNLVGRSANRAKGTMVHEIGHWIDQQLVGPKLAGSDVGQFATTNQRNHPLMANWFRAVHQSRAYQQLDTAYEMARKGQRYTRVKADGTVTTGLYDQKYLDYARNDKELWARAYAQYIGRKTKDPDILEEMREESDKLVKRHHFTQWEDDDFDAIEEAFDRLFEGIGVMG